jgi:excisionase family DNA binding protein
MAEDLPKLLTATEAAEFLGWHPEYLRRMARQGKVPAVRLRRGWRFYATTLQEWLAQGCPSPAEQPSLFEGRG